ncbi:MAG: TVP38/TMEM64 family protein [Candidatus Goldiibacteriota bacterium]
MKKEIKAVLFVLFLGFVIYVLKFSPLSDYFFTEEGREVFFVRFDEYIKGMGVWAPLIFVCVYTLSIIFFVPASIFTTLGGLLFGNWAGLWLNLMGAYIGGTLSFLMARYLLGDFAAKILESKHFQKLDDKAVEHGFSIIIYLRLMFVPFTYLSFAAGLSKIKFRDFFWATVIGVVPGLVVVTFLAAAVKELAVMYAAHKSIAVTLGSDMWRGDVVIPVVLFAFSFFIPTIIKRFKKRFFVTEEIEKKSGGE